MVTPNHTNTNATTTTPVTFIGADRDALLWEACILLDVPNLQDPVRVQSVNPATPLIAHEVNNVVVLERWSSTKVNTLERLGGRDVVLTELVLSVQEHHLAQRVHCLERLWLDTCTTELELL